MMSQSLPQGAAVPPLFAGYAQLPGTWDELLDARGLPREGFGWVLDELGRKTADELCRSQRIADLSLLSRGVTFNVYKDSRGAEKILPFDVMPRIIGAPDWDLVSHGLEQRVRALELFLDDVYGEGRIIAQGRVPRDLVFGSSGYLPALRGVRAPGGVRIHIAGIDLIRDACGTLRVLEDNLRTPSGVSYVMENRVVTKRVFPAAFDRARVHRVDQYPAHLGEALRSVAPEGAEDAAVVLLTPGPFNAAFFEHTFLARSMGIDLVQPADLFVEGDLVFLRTTRGPSRVHTVYRRIDDPFLDPDLFRADSLLGVRGIVRAWAAGKVALANAPGNGVADDKAIYPFVPEMIRYFLGEAPILEQVETFQCLREGDRAYVLSHLDSLVVKCVDEAGGCGMLMGPASTSTEREEFARRVEADPRRYIAQHRVELSTCPTWDGERRRMGARRVDLRPYIVTGRDGPWVLPGGLTRVALVEGSYVVNSSQGGGSKDTWVQRP